MLFKERFNSLISLISNHIKKFSLLLLFGLFVPFLAFADWGLETLFNGLIFAVLRFILWVSKGAAYLSIAFFNYVTSPGFMPLSYTNPAGNPIIELGLEITRPFANLIIVFFLIIIGLATALNYKDYAAKKLLPWLVGAALLINFVPLILGVIMDGANTVTFYFFENIGEGTTILQNNLLDLGGGSFEPSGGEKVTPSLLYRAVVAIAFYAFVAWTFFIYAFIFFIRYIYIWTLVILSPLTFVAGVIPATRKLFTKWWEDFIHWAFIGIPAGFFIYIGLQMLARIQDILPKMAIIQAQEFGKANELLINILPSIVVMVFLWLGSKEVKKLASDGASVAIGAAGAIATGGASAAASAGNWFGKKIRSSKVGQGVASKGEKWETVTGKKGTKTFHRYATRPLGKKMKDIASDKDDYHSGKEEIKGEDLSDQLYSILQATGTDREGKIAQFLEERGEKGRKILEKKIEKEDIVKVREKAGKMEDKSATKKIDQSFAKILAKAEGKDDDSLFNKFKDILHSQTSEEARIKKDDIEALGDEIKDEIVSVNNITLSSEDIKYAENAKEDTEEVKKSIKNQKIQKALRGVTKKEMKEKGYRNYLDKVVDNAKSEEDIKDLKGTIKEKKTIEAVHRFWTGDQISKGVKELGKDFLESFTKGLKSAEWYVKKDSTGKMRNIQLPSYLISNASLPLGTPTIRDENGNEINNKKELRAMSQNPNTGSSSSSSQSSSKSSSQSSGDNTSKKKTSKRRRAAGTKKSSKTSRSRGGFGSSKKNKSDEKEGGRERGTL